MIRSNSSLRESINRMFFLKTFLVVSMVIALDMIIGNILQSFYFKQESGLNYRTTYSIEKTNADVLIFGSSTAIHNYVPAIFQNRLNLSTYSVGRDGNSIFYDYAVLRAIMKRYTPKMILLDFEKHEFNDNPESYDRLACLLPYYKGHPEMDSIINLKSPFEKYKLLSSIYPYNSSLFTIAVGNAEFNKSRQVDLNGYVPLSDIWNDSIQDGTAFLNHPLDPKKIRVYEAFIRDCINANITLYIVCPPLFMKPNYTSNSVELGKKIAAKYNIKFLDYLKDASIIYNRLLFADISHLNNTGASEYSNKVIDDIVKNREGVAGKSEDSMNVVSGNPGPVVRKKL